MTIKSTAHLAEIWSQIGDQLSNNPFLAFEFISHPERTLERLGYTLNAAARATLLAALPG